MIRIRKAGWDMENVEVRKPVAISMWYDRHTRAWVLYPVSVEGYQLDTARYGFSRAEAKAIKEDWENELGLKGR